MYDAERLVAVGDRLHDDAETENVGKLLEADRLALHFAPDRICALAPARNPRGDAAIGQFPGELFLDFSSQMLVAFGQPLEPSAHDLVGLRIELAERQIVQLLAHLMHAHAARERRIDFQRLLGGAAARLDRHVVERAHVVQTVGELHQQHAHVVSNRQQQLAQVFRLLGFLCDQVKFLELG